MDLTPRQQELIEGTRTHGWLHELFTIEELSEFLGVSIRTIQRMHAHGQGPRRIRKSYRLMYPIPDLLDWLSAWKKYMPRKNYDPRASSEKMARLAINPDWSCNPDDPRNARYLRPLSIAADEKMASHMAEAIYGAVAEKHAEDRTFSSDEVYRQCLINARRMLRDREYWGLFMGKQDFTPPLQ
jgi:hypothetical protein